VKKWFAVTDITQTNVPGLYIAIFQYLPPVMPIYIMCLDILFIHFPASTHRVVVATGSPLMMVTAPFLQMGELLPGHPVTYTLEDMIPGPSPPVSTALEPAASASYHPSGRPSPCSCVSHSNAVSVHSHLQSHTCMTIKSKKLLIKKIY